MQFAYLTGAERINVRPATVSQFRRVKANIINANEGSTNADLRVDHKFRKSIGFLSHFSFLKVHFISIFITPYRYPLNDYIVFGLRISLTFLYFVVVEC